MITEEKMQKLLDDLRIGKYDSFNYTVKYSYGGLILEDINKNVKLKLTPYKEYKISVTKHKCWLKKEWKKKEWEYFIKIAPASEKVSLDITENVKASEDLFRSWIIFINEQREKEKLIFKSNLESAFGL